MCFFNIETYEMKKNLVLIGMMGSGKSTIGRLLSNITNLNLIDTDKLIEKETKLEIKDIFQKKGENFFYYFFFS